MGRQVIEPSDAIGLFGVALSVYCYGRVQWRRDYAKRISYSSLNLLSSALLFPSLAAHWNLASFTINAVWGLISLYGVYRCLKYVWRHRNMQSIED